MSDSERDRLRKENARLRRVAEASYALYTTLDLGELLRLIMDAAKAGVDADRGTVFLMSDDGKELWSRVLTGDGDLEIRLPVGQGIAGTVAATGKTVRLDDARKDPRFDSSWDEKSGYTTKELLTAPIRNRDGEVTGVFQLLNKHSGNFDEEDEAYLAALSVHVSLAVENARLHGASIEKERQDREIMLVQGVQRAYQPERQETASGVFHAAGMNMLCEDASGDYYDFIELPSGRVAVVVGDVAGHGLGAALVMAQARALLRAFAETIGTLPEVMNLLNDFLSRDMSRGRFMSMILAVADAESGLVVWQNAGHPPGFLYRAASGEVDRLDPNGRVLGVLEGAGYADTQPVTMEPGDVLLFYTDGATEAARPDGTFLDEAGLESTLKRLADRPPADVLEGVRETLVEWTGSETFKDDLTLVALKRAPQ